MATTEINVTALTAVGSLKQVVLNLNIDTVAGCLQYLSLKNIQIWESTTNNRANATKIGETTGLQYTRTGLPDGINTRYYWAKAVNNAGTEGPFYPASATAGVAGTTTNTAPGPGSVGSTELADNAVTTQKIANLAVTDAKIQQLSASKISSGTITASISIEGPTITGGLIRTSSGSSRVEMSSSGNYFAVNIAGSQVAYIGTSGITPTLAVSSYSLTALDASGNSGNTNAHAARMKTPGGGGWGLGGVTPGGGGYAFYAEVGAYGPFTGSHDAFIDLDAPGDVGDIVYDVRVISRNGVDDTVTEVDITYTEYEKRVVGVISKRVEFSADSLLSALPPLTGDSLDPNITSIRRYLAENYDRLTINSVGEGQMNVCGLGGNIEAGDYIVSSSLPGKGQRQNNSSGWADDVYRNFTVAKARESIVFDKPSQVKRIACIYLCG